MSALNSQRMGPKERVRMKIGLLKEALSFMYSCFVLQKMIDGNYSKRILSFMDVSMCVGWCFTLIKFSVDVSMGRFNNNSAEILC